VIIKKQATDANLQGINEFINGSKPFADVLDDYAKVYADVVNSNKKIWSWREDILGGDKLTYGQKKLIKEKSISEGYLPNVQVQKIEGMKYGFANFKSEGLVKYEVDLPEAMWKLSDERQFSWLDKQIGGTVEGYTWHHTEIPGKMQLVPSGVHDIITHNGGRTTGMWADAPR